MTFPGVVCSVVPKSILCLRPTPRVQSLRLNKMQPMARFTTCESTEPRMVPSIAVINDVQSNHTVRNNARRHGRSSTLAELNLWFGGARPYSFLPFHLTLAHLHTHLNTHLHTLTHTPTHLHTFALSSLLEALVETSTTASSLTGVSTPVTAEPNLHSSDVDCLFRAVLNHHERPVFMPGCSSCR